MDLEAMDAEEAEDGGPITKSAAAALPAAEMPAAAALVPAAGEAPAPAAGEAPAPAHIGAKCLKTSNNLQFGQSHGFL